MRLRKFLLNLCLLLSSIVFFIVSLLSRNGSVVDEGNQINYGPDNNLDFDLAWDSGGKSELERLRFAHKWKLAEIEGQIGSPNNSLDQEDPFLAEVVATKFIRPARDIGEPYPENLEQAIRDPKTRYG